MSEQRVPVVIVGGGPVGLAAANLLGGYGVSTLLLERDLELCAHPRVVSIDDEALRVFQMMGLAQELLGDMLPDPLMRVFAGDGRRLAELRMRGAPYGFARIAMVLQPLIEKSLRAGAARFSSIECRFGHQVESLTPAAEGISLAVRGGNDARYTVHADYVLGCDGGRSLVRSSCGIALRGTTLPERWLIIDLRQQEALSSQGELRIYGDRRRPAVFAQLPHGFQRWEVRLLPDEDADAMERLAPARLQQLLRRYEAGWPAAAPPQLVRQRVYQSHTRIAERFQAQRVFLLGDAAHLMPPFAGQGLASGLRDAANLCWKLAWVLRGDAGPSVLASYDRERRRHVGDSLAASMHVGALFFPRSWLRDLMRQILFKLVMAAPAIHRRVEQSTKPLPMSSAGLFVGGPPAGTLLVQPALQTAAGGSRLLDELLGPGLAIVGLDCDPLSAVSDSARAFCRQQRITSLRIVPPASALSVADGESTVAQDHRGALSRWFQEHRATVVLVRPDRYVAAAARGPAAVGPALDKFRALLLAPAAE